MKPDLKGEERSNSGGASIARRFQRPGQSNLNNGARGRRASNRDEDEDDESYYDNEYGDDVGSDDDDDDESEYVDDDDEEKKEELEFDNENEYSPSKITMSKNDGHYLIRKMDMADARGLSSPEKRMLFKRKEKENAVSGFSLA